MNEAQQRRLEAALEERGARCFPALSEPDDGGEGEASVLAFIDRETATELGRRFLQNAIVVGEAGGAAELLWLR